jgi:ABC-type taurine transport system substrate-binding protein
MVQSSGWIGAAGSWVSTHSATKSAKTWDLMAFRGANEIVSPIISTAHFAILPEASRHWMISPRGKDDVTPLVLLLLKLEHGIINIGIAYV